MRMKKILTEEEIEENKKLYIALLKSIDRPRSKIDELIEVLEKSDFFIAPASSKYHNAFKGGLCQHCLNVYSNMQTLAKNIDTLDPACYDENSLIISALLHDISKMNIYEITTKNVKQYHSAGSKKDDLGRFDWKTELGYATKENKFVYGNHEETSEYIARQYINLTIDESVAILHHMGGMSWDSSQTPLSTVFPVYSLALLLHIADMLATYVNERE